MLKPIDSSLHVEGYVIIYFFSHGHMTTGFLFTSSKMTSCELWREETRERERSRGGGERRLGEAEVEVVGGDGLERWKLGGGRKTVWGKNIHQLRWSRNVSCVCIRNSFEASALRVGSAASFSPAGKTVFFTGLCSVRTFTSWGDPAM